MKALGIAAAIVIGTLMLGTACLALIPGEGEPVAILHIDPAPEFVESSSPESVPAPEPAAAVPAFPPPVGTAVDIPPGLRMLVPATAAE